MRGQESYEKMENMSGECDGRDQEKKSQGFVSRRHENFTKALQMTFVFAVSIYACHLEHANDTNLTMVAYIDGPSN